MNSRVLDRATSEVPRASMAYRVRRAVLDDVATHGVVRTDAIVERCGADPRDVYAAVAALVRKQVIAGTTSPDPFGLRAPGRMRLTVRRGRRLLRAG